ncbi:MAG: rod shape-determining protein MreC [Acidobacteria bacterium]|nr:MAG: rod shape-determining protein MreC [Acidobacteriota bacterium]
MESVLGRYRNLIVLVGVLFLQVLGLAVQVKRTTENEPTRLIRIWTVSTVTPLEKGLVSIQRGIRNLWHNYFFLRGVRAENRELKQEIERLRLQQVRLSEDAEQARRLQTLLAFKEQFISKTVAAQVIGSSGSEQSRSIYIDKGAHDGIAPDMAVITADGIVGKVMRVFRSTSLVLLIDDQSSGVGAILAKSRLQGVLHGRPSGEVVLEKIMNDEPVQAGEPVLTSGGDQIFPKGLPVGTVSKASKGSESFLDIRVRPAANLSKLEEVLVIAQKEERAPSLSQTTPVRAVDVLAGRLPSVPDKPATEDPNKTGTTANSNQTTPQTVGVRSAKTPVVGSTAAQSAQGSAELTPKPTPANAARNKSVGNASPSSNQSVLPASPTPSDSPASHSRQLSRKPTTVAAPNNAANGMPSAAKPDQRKPDQPKQDQPKQDQPKRDQPGQDQTPSEDKPQ